MRKIVAFLIVVAAIGTVGCATMKQPPIHTVDQVDIARSWAIGM